MCSRTQCCPSEQRYGRLLNTSVESFFLFLFFFLFSFLHARITYWRCHNDETSCAFLRPSVATLGRKKRTCLNGGLTHARTLGTLGNLQFLVPHSLTLPEYLSQFECKLDYYSLMFTMRSSSVASLFLVSPCDKANMCRDLRRNVFFH